MRKLPTNRPPMHPGEMLLEEFLKPESLPGRIKQCGAVTLSDCACC